MKCRLGKSHNEKHLVADSGLVRAAGEMCTIREIMHVFKEPWLEGGQQGPLSVSTIQALKEADCWEEMCLSIKQETRDLNSRSSSHSFELGAAAVINPVIKLLVQQVTNPSWRRSWLCSLAVQCLSQLLPAYSPPL